MKTDDLRVLRIKVSELAREVAGDLQLEKVASLIDEMLIEVERLLREGEEQ